MPSIWSAFKCTVFTSRRGAINLQEWRRRKRRHLNAAACRVNRYSGFPRYVIGPERSRLTSTLEERIEKPTQKGIAARQ